MYIQWKKSYETGHSLIDAEHRLLVMLFRKLDVAIKTRESETSVSRIVQEVKQYVKFHFISEENLMYETNYPRIEGHIAIHTHLLVELNNMTSKLTLHQEFPEDVLDFLSDWLTNHIAHHDQLLAKHVDSATDRPVAELIYPEYLQTIITQVSTPD
ncbi:MAG: hemerythrin family protein [Nitrosomonas sp.]|nr:hemerythrin family protein [Nitrosomonas sp.]